MIGILILDTDFPRLPGDIGNPDSFAVETIYHRVGGASVDAVVSGQPIIGDLLDNFIEAAQALEQQGATTIGTSCGFLGAVQSEIQAAVSVPFLASSLSLIPLLRTAYGADSKIAVLTFDAEKLGAAHFGPVSRSNITVHGLPPECHWRRCITGDETDLNQDEARRNTLGVAREAATANPDLLLVECTNLSPWKQEIREQTRLPVFDLVDALEWLHSAC